MEFSSTMENLVVATALEIHRTGHWLIPELEGEARVAKPPLAAWIAAATIRPSTFRDLDSPDATMRTSAYYRLAWDVRWPALASSCLMLIAIFEFGRNVAGAKYGLIAMVVAATSIYFLRFGRQMTTDVQLALWVSVADAAIARLALRRVTWAASIVAGLALALALMSKGPVALLMAVAPVLPLLWRRAVTRWLPLIAAMFLAIVAGGAWYALVAARMNVWSRWAVELSRSGTLNHAGNALSYASILPYMLPWTPGFLLGLAWMIVEAKRRAVSRAWLLPLLLVIVPVVVMSFFPDRKERYLLPLLGPAALLTARGLSEMFDSDRPGVPRWLQWATLLVIAVALPVAGATKWLVLLDERPWYSIPLAIVLVLCLGSTIAAAWVATRQSATGILIAASIVMLLLTYVFFLAYRDSLAGRSDLRPLAEVIRERYPSAEMYYWRPEGKKRASVDLSIYLNRSTVWTADPAALPPTSSRPPVYIALQHRGEAEPQPRRGWTRFASLTRDEDRWFAFVRERTSQ
jgi:4-amino-4-deoxy-L-arabinose transferase-like glycosyltransferase